MQNSARFRTTSKFGGEYPRNGWIYAKSDYYFVYRNSSCVKRNKSGEVWSSDLGDLNVKSYPPKVHFSDDHISAPRGCCVSNFLYALENDQVLLAHLHRWRGPFLQFFQRGVKNGLKCNKRALITWELESVAWRNFGTWRVSRLWC